MDTEQLHSERKLLTEALRDSRRISAIKAVRAMTGAGLMESKLVVDALFDAVMLAEKPAKPMPYEPAPSDTPSQWAYYIVHSNDGHCDTVAHFRGASWNFDDAMNYAQGRVDDNENATVAKVIATTQHALKVL